MPKRRREEEEDGEDVNKLSTFKSQIDKKAREIVSDVRFSVVAFFFFVGILDDNTP